MSTDTRLQAALKAKDWEEAERYALRAGIAPETFLAAVGAHLGTEERAMVPPPHHTSPQPCFLPRLVRDVPRLVRARPGGGTHLHGACSRRWELLRRSGSMVGRNGALRILWRCR